MTKVKSLQPPKEIIKHIWKKCIYKVVQDHVAYDSEMSEVSKCPAKRDWCQCLVNYDFKTLKAIKSLELCQERIEWEKEKENLTQSSMKSADFKM